MQLGDNSQDMTVTIEAMFRERLKHTASGGKCHPATVPIKKPGPYFFFQRANLGGDRRLSDQQPLCGTGKTLLSRNSRNVLSCSKSIKPSFLKASTSGYIWPQMRKRRERRISFIKIVYITKDEAGRKLELFRARVPCPSEYDSAGFPPNAAMPWLSPGIVVCGSVCLEAVPEGLVVDGVVVLHFRDLDKGSQQAGTAVGGILLQVRVSALHVGPQQFGRPLRVVEVVDRRVDVVRQIALRCRRFSIFAVSPSSPVLSRA